MNAARSGRLALMAVLAISTSPDALAQYGRGMEDFETPHNLSYAAGFASPSQTNALFENPSGLMYNQAFKILAQGVTNSSDFSVPGGSLGLFLGNGFVGGALTFDFASARSGGTQGTLNAGLGTFISPANLAFGVSANYSLWNLTGGSTGLANNSIWGINSGLLYNPQGEWRIGLTGNQIGTGNECVGLGFAWDPGGWATLALDASKFVRGDGIALKPGMGLHFYNFQMSIGWGIPLQPGAYSMRIGPELGLGVRFSYNVHLQAYYNHLTLYQVGLLIQI